jgi:hypothetical protein
MGEEVVMRQWVIEFRSGSFFQDIEAECGGRVQSAQRFDTKKEAETFMDQNKWLYVNGGMVVECEFPGDDLLLAWVT